MKIYAKKLVSLEDLKKERLLLKAQLKEQDLFANTTAKEANLSSSLLSGILSGLSQKSLLNTALKVAPLLWSTINSKQPSSTNQANNKTAKNSLTVGTLLDMAIKEFVGGYLKWKTGVLLYKGIKWAIQYWTEDKVDGKKSSTI